MATPLRRRTSPYDEAINGDEDEEDEDDDEEVDPKEVDGRDPLCPHRAIRTAGRDMCFLPDTREAAFHDEDDCRRLTCLPTHLGADDAQMDVVVELHFNQAPESAFNEVWQRRELPIRVAVEAGALGIKPVVFPADGHEVTEKVRVRTPRERPR